MMREELLQQLRELGKGDREEEHAVADGLLLEYINDAQVSAAYEAIPKWYA